MLPTDYGHVRTVSRETYVGSNLCPSTTGAVSTEPIDAYALAGPLFVSVVLYGAGLVIHLVEKAKGVRQKAATLVRTLSKERAVAAFSSKDRADPRVDNEVPMEVPAPEPETVEGVMQVTCPADGVPGASMEVTADGQQVTVQIPEGAEPNKPFAIKLPVREPEPQPEPTPEPEPAPDDESSLAPPSAP